MDLAVEKMVWSKNFWVRKLIRAAIAALLVLLLTQIWNWPTQQDNPTTTNTAPSANQTPAAAPAEQPKPAEPVFPYTITLPQGVTGPQEVTQNSSQGYQYTFTDTATMTIFPQGLGVNATDVTWTHEFNTDGKLTVTNQPTTLCALGTTNCTAGNGTIDITSRSAEGQQHDYVIVIKDTNIATKTFQQAQAQYQDIINTIKVAK